MKTIELKRKKSTKDKIIKDKKIVIVEYLFKDDYVDINVKLPFLSYETIPSKIKMNIFPVRKGDIDSFYLFEIVKYLAVNPNSVLTEIAMHLNTDNSTASKYLNMLKKEGYIKKKKVGKTYVYNLLKV